MTPILNFDPAAQARRGSRAEVAAAAASPANLRLEKSLMIELLDDLKRARSVQRRGR